MATKNIRNFCIIAHIDHGKSTLADRILEYTGALSDREMAAAGGDQVLDDMDLERERGITIKAHAVRLTYRASDGQDYVLNLIDTPGHVDFTYEVSRSLAACEGALLVVDASQGVEAQTLANAYLALDHNLEIIPVINKIDLPSANIEDTKMQIEDVIGLDAAGAIPASAKEGIGTREILESVVRNIPPPSGDSDAPLRALLFDSWYDTYQGVVVLVRVVDGSVSPGQKIKLFSMGAMYEIQSVGVFTPKMVQTKELFCGEVGYIIAGIKRVADAKIGDTIMDATRPAEQPLPGYKDVKPMVFAGLYPMNSDDYEDLKDALEKLRLNDSSFTYEPETSLALGFGFRCGFLGLLHMDIIKERIEREFKLSLIPTAPTVVYRVTKNNWETVLVDNPAKLPNIQDVQRIEEPFIIASIITPELYVGPLIALCQERPHIEFRRDDRSDDERLFNALDILNIRQFCGIVHENGLPVIFGDPVDHRRRRGYERQLELTLDPLFDDIHVKEPEKTAAEPEPEGKRGLGFITERRIVQPELFERVLEVCVIIAVHGIETGKDHGLDVFITGKRLCRLPGRVHDRIADLRVRHAFDAGDDVSHFSAEKLFCLEHLRCKDADGLDLVRRTRRKELDLLSRRNLAVNHLDEHHDTLIRVIP